MKRKSAAEKRKDKQIASLRRRLADAKEDVFNLGADIINLRRDKEQLLRRVGEMTNIAFKRLENKEANLSNKVEVLQEDNDRLRAKLLEQGIKNNVVPIKERA